MTIEAAFFGTLGSDAERRVSKTNKPYLRLNIRTGEGDAAVWISVMAFDPRAIEQADKLVKGARVYAEGSLRPTEWTGQDGAQRHGLSVLAWHCRLAQIGRHKIKRAPKPRDRVGELKASAAAAVPFNDTIGF